MPKVRLNEALRSEIRERADELGLTYDEYLRKILPEAAMPLVRKGDSTISVSDETLEKLNELSGEGTDLQEVIRHYHKKHNE